MAAFDFVESAAGGYRFVWQARETIMRLAAVPFALKIASFIAITALAIDNNILRQGLLLLPATFAEGWLIAQAIRLAIFDERWPMNLSGDRKKDMALMQVRARSISAATLIYVLTKLALAFVSAMMFMNMSTPTAADVPPPGPGMFFVGFAVLTLAVWSFRFFWLHIPAALDQPLRGYILKTRGYLASFCMLATWLLCYVPLFLLLFLAREILTPLLPPVDGEVSTAYTYAMVVVWAFVDSASALVSSLGVAYGVRAMDKGKTARGKN
jgi:hypothetical protein